MLRAQLVNPTDGPIHRTTVVLLSVDKSGLHPQLTLRLLRKQMEKKLGLEMGVLRPKRDYIKKLTLKWYAGQDQDWRPMTTTIIRIVNCIDSDLHQQTTFAFKNRYVRKVEENGDAAEDVHAYQRLSKYATAAGTLAV
jgi:hypothetical protein